MSKMNISKVTLIKLVNRIKLSTPDVPGAQSFEKVVMNMISEPQDCVFKTHDTEFSLYIIIIYYHVPIRLNSKTLFSSYCWCTFH